MTTTTTVDQISYVFTFPFQDSDWKRKLGIGFLIFLAGFLIPLIPWILAYGYFARLTRVAHDNQGRPELPEWDEWGQLALDGLRLAVVYFVALLPFFLAFGCGYLSFFLPAFSSLAVEGAQVEEALILTLTSMGATFLGIMVFSLGLVLMFVITFILPPLLAHVAVQDRLGAALEVGQWWGILRANLGGFAISYILLFGSAFLLFYAIQLVYATLILCCLIPFLISLLAVYLTAVSGALVGQSYWVGKEKVAGQIPPGP